MRRLLTGSRGLSLFLLLLAGVILAGCQATQEQAVTPPEGSLEIHASDCYGEPLPFCRLVLERVTDSVLENLSDSLPARRFISTERAAEAATDSTGVFTFVSLSPGYYNVHLAAPLPNVDASGDCTRGGAWFVRVARDSVSLVTVAQVDRTRPPETERIQWQPTFRSRS